MHVLVPVERRYTYDDTREFSEIVAGAIARTHRGLATTEWAKSKRRGVLIDSNQNGEGKTIASVVLGAAEAGAPVSTPLRWDEVNESLDPSAFTMDVVLERVRKHGDLFDGVLTTSQRIDKALNASLGRSALPPFRAYWSVAADDHRLEDEEVPALRVDRRLHPVGRRCAEGLDAGEVPRARPLARVIGLSILK